ncbi:LytR/AlgR family response regulator transcription factor [Paenibacillus sp. CAU 1782]
MNLTIAICDDNRTEASKLEQLLEVVFSAMPDIAFNIDIYETGEGLLHALETCSYPLLFLDMEIPGRDGIEVAEIIRQFDKDMLIIFVTSHINYMQRSFEVRPFRYLLKPVDLAGLESAALKAVEELLQRNNWLEFTYKQTSWQLKSDDIMYVTVERGKKLIIAAKRDTCMYYGRLGELEAKLAPHGFCRIHTGYLVNWQYVRAVAKDKVTLANGIVLPVSRARSGETVISYHRYLEKRFLR